MACINYSELKQLPWSNHLNRRPKTPRVPPSYKPMEKTGLGLHFPLRAPRWHKAAITKCKEPFLLFERVYDITDLDRSETAVRVIFNDLIARAARTGSADVTTALAGLYLVQHRLLIVYGYEDKRKYGRARNSFPYQMTGLQTDFPNDLQFVPRGYDKDGSSDHLLVCLHDIMLTLRHIHTMTGSYCKRLIEVKGEVTGSDRVPRVNPYHYAVYDEIYRGSTPLYHNVFKPIYYKSFFAYGDVDRKLYKSILALHMLQKTCLVLIQLSDLARVCKEYGRALALAHLQLHCTTYISLITRCEDLSSQCYTHVLTFWMLANCYYGLWECYHLPSNDLINRHYEQYLVANKDLRSFYREIDAFKPFFSRELAEYDETRDRYVFPKTSGECINWCLTYFDSVDLPQLWQHSRFKFEWIGIMNQAIALNTVAEKIAGNLSQENRRPLYDPRNIIRVGMLGLSLNPGRKFLYSRLDVCVTSKLLSARWLKLNAVSADGRNSMKNMKEICGFSDSRISAYERNMYKNMMQNLTEAVNMFESPEGIPLLDKTRKEYVITLKKYIFEQIRVQLELEHRLETYDQGMDVLLEMLCMVHRVWEVEEDWENELVRRQAEQEQSVRGNADANEEGNLEEPVLERTASEQKMPEPLGSFRTLMASVFAGFYMMYLSKYEWSRLIFKMVKHSGALNKQNKMLHNAFYYSSVVAMYSARFPGVADAVIRMVLEQALLYRKCRKDAGTGTPLRLQHEYSTVHRLLFLLPVLWEMCIHDLTPNGPREYKEVFIEDIELPFTDENLLETFPESQLNKLTDVMELMQFSFWSHHRLESDGELVGDRNNAAAVERANELKFYVKQQLVGAVLRYQEPFPQLPIIVQFSAVRITDKMAKAIALSYAHGNFRPRADQNNALTNKTMLSFYAAHKALSLCDGVKFFPSTLTKHSFTGAFVLAQVVVVSIAGGLLGFDYGHTRPVRTAAEHGEEIFRDITEKIRLFTIKRWPTDDAMPGMRLFDNNSVVDDVSQDSDYFEEDVVLTWVTYFNCLYRIRDQMTRRSYVTGTIVQSVDDLFDDLRSQSEKGKNIDMTLLVECMSTIITQASHLMEKMASSDIAKEQCRLADLLASCITKKASEPYYIDSSKSNSITREEIFRFARNDVVTETVAAAEDSDQGSDSTVEPNILTGNLELFRLDEEQAESVPNDLFPHVDFETMVGEIPDMGDHTMLNTLADLHSVFSVTLVYFKENCQNNKLKAGLQRILEGLHDEAVDLLLRLVMGLYRADRLINDGIVSKILRGRIQTLEDEEEAQNFVSDGDEM